MGQHWINLRVFIFTSCLYSNLNPQILTFILCLGKQACQWDALSPCTTRNRSSRSSRAAEPPVQLLLQPLLHVHVHCQPWLGLWVGTWSLQESVKHQR